jgi:hypothetical protein
MKHLSIGLLAVVALCLVKVAFFPRSQIGDMIVPQALAQGSVVEWQATKRIVTTSGDGTTIYVWDCDAKTEARKYSIRNDAIVLETFRIGK